MHGKVRKDSFQGVALKVLITDENVQSLSIALIQGVGKFEWCG